jgi:hypothetical protein
MRHGWTVPLLRKSFGAPVSLIPNASVAVEASQLQVGSLNANGRLGFSRKLVVELVAASWSIDEYRTARWQVLNPPNWRFPNVSSAHLRKRCASWERLAEMISEVSKWIVCNKSI